MTRLSLVAATLAFAIAPAMSPTFAQEVPPVDECEPTTLFEAFGVEPIEGCETPVEGEPELEVGDDEGAAGGNAVSIAAKLPGNNREAALAHANERSGGAVEAAHANRDSGESESRGGGNGGGNGNGKR
jgi:hypothetical protein